MKKYWYVLVLGASIVLISSYVVQIPIPSEPPSNLEAETLSTTEIKLRWQDNSTNEERFEIERKAQVEEWSQIKTVEANIIEYTDIGLSTGMTYYYKIRSYNTKEHSNYSNTVSAITMSPSSTIKVWQKTYGGSRDEDVYSVQQTEDGGYIIAGETEFFGARGFGFYVIKLDSNGNEEWQEIYSEFGYNGVSFVQQTQDGGYIVAEDTYSFDTEREDVYIIKLDSKGNEEWLRTYGESSCASIKPVQQTEDGGYIVTGSTTSFGARRADAYIIKLDSKGNEEWRRIYGRNGYEEARSVQQTEDGGYIVAGSTTSFGGRKVEVYIIKLDSNGNKEWEKTYGGSDDDVACYVEQTEDGGYIVAGDTYSFGAGAYDFYLVKTDAEGNTAANP